MNARLKVLHDKANVKQVKLLPTTVIGRSTECDLKIASSQVSRVHCRITVKDDAVYIEDLGSANGTFVNDQMLNPRQPTAVEPGAKVTIGPAEFLVDYIAPTSNTVVIRRSDTGGKPVREETDGAGKELIFTSTTEATEETESEATLVGERMENLIAAAMGVALPEATSKKEDKQRSTATVPVIPGEFLNPAPVFPPVVPVAKVPDPVSKPVSAPAPNPVIKAAVAVGSGANETRAPSAVPKPAIAVPVTPPVARAVAVAAPAAVVVPTARAVAMPAQVIAPVQRAEPVQLPPENPFQFDQAQPAKAKLPGTPTKSPIPPPAKVAAPMVEPAAAPLPEMVAPQPFGQFGEVAESAPAVQEEASGFNFSASEEPPRTAKPASKPAKGGGLKSLLSVFGRKTESKSKVSAPPQEEPVEEQVESPAEAPAEEIPEPSPFAFGAESAEESHAGSADNAPPDDFQDFLKQF